MTDYERKPINIDKFKLTKVQKFDDEQIIKHAESSGFLQGKIDGRTLRKKPDPAKLMIATDTTTRNRFINLMQEYNLPNFDSLLKYLLDNHKSK